MRIAVLSDLHANAQAMEAVMNDVIEQQCEHVFCLGDIALAGTQPKGGVPAKLMIYFANKKPFASHQHGSDAMECGDKRLGLLTRIV